MEVKEAVEIINGMHRRIIGEWAHSDKEEEDIRKRIDNIIFQLQQGEKYRQMWEELDEEYGHIDLMSVGVSKPLFQWMDDITQKYFPKATCEEIKEAVKILKKYELKPDKDGLITIKYFPKEAKQDYPESEE